MSPDFLSYSPITMRSGFRVSWRADPSRRNSGFMHRSKSVPHRLPEWVSRIGLIFFSVVPGGTVLLTTTR